MKIFKIQSPNKFTNSQLFRKQTGFALYTKDDDFYVAGCETQAEADAAIAAHNPPAPTELTVEEKLASVGLNLNDLKAALGL